MEKLLCDSDSDLQITLEKVMRCLCESVIMRRNGARFCAVSLEETNL